MIPPRQAGRDEDREEGHATRRNEDPPARSQHRELGGQSTEDVRVDDGLMARHCEGKVPPAARRWPWSTSRWPPASWRRPGEPGPEAIRPAACGRSPRRWTECGMRFSPCLVGPAPGLWRLAPASPLQGELLPETCSAPTIRLVWEGCRGGFSRAACEEGRAPPPSP